MQRSISLNFVKVFHEIIWLLALVSFRSEVLQDVEVGVGKDELIRKYQESSLQSWL